MVLAQGDGQEGGVALPTEIQIIPAGWVETETQGRFLLDTEAIRSIQDAFDQSGRQLVLDYEHQTLTGDEAPAAGWITQLLDKGEVGLWGAVSWTARGAAYVQNREYRYLSPVVLVRKSDRRAVRLHSVALTNTPEIRNLLPLVAKTAISHQLSATSQEEEDRMREKLIEILQLKADATDAEIAEAVQAIRAKATAAPAPAAPDVLTALGLKAEASLSETIATVHALKQGQVPADTITALQTEVKTLKAQLAAQQGDDLVEAALKAGKITPAQTDWAKDYAQRDPEGFKVFVAKSPIVVIEGKVVTPLAERRGDGLDDSQRQINRSLGISDELFKKHQSKA